MTRTLTIAARELRERSFVFVSAAIVALIPFIAAALPNSRSAGREPVILVAGMIVALGFTFGLAIILGGSMIGRDLSEKRLSFYFSKPVSASAIWFGKVVGALVTVAACFAIVFLPSYLTARSAWSPSWNESVGVFAGAVLIGATYLLLVSHAGSTMVRSRSPLVALDLALLAGAVAVVWLLIRPLLVNFALEVVRNVLVFIVAGLGVAIFAGGAWQLSRGRTDLLRSHRELSRSFWTAMAVVIGLAAAYVAWVFAAGPSDLINRYATGNATGDWMTLSGIAKQRGDYHPTFLIDIRTGKAIRFPAARWSGAEFTRKGNAVVTISPIAENGWMQHGELHVQMLGSPRVETNTGIPASIWSRVVLSDDLHRAAILDSQLLSVYDLPAKALLGSVRVPFAKSAQLFFVSPTLVRLYAVERTGPGIIVRPQELRIFEFDVSSRRLQQTGTFSTIARAPLPVRASADGSRLVVRSNVQDAQQRVFILDGRTGAQKATIEGPTSWFVSPLVGGGAAVVSIAQEIATLRVFDGGGHPLRDITLGRAHRTGIIREIVPGRKLVVAVRRSINVSMNRGWDLCVIDVQRGVVERVEHDYFMRAQYIFNADPRVPDPNLGGEFIIADAHETLWRWNALTGARTKIL